MKYQYQFFFTLILFKGGSSDLESTLLITLIMVCFNVPYEFMPGFSDTLVNEIPLMKCQITFALFSFRCVKALLIYQSIFLPF